MSTQLRFYQILLICTLLFFLFIFTPSSFSEDLHILPIDEGRITKDPTTNKTTRDFGISMHLSDNTTNTLFSTLYYSSEHAKNTHSVLGPVLKMNRGDTVRVNIQNTLPIQSSVHWHGIKDMPSLADGVFYPINKNASVDIEFTLDQPSSTSWFHPHIHGTTADQVYRGLIGVALVEDTNNLAAIKLPHTYGVDDFVLVLTDKEINNNKQVDYRVTEMDYRMKGYRGNYVLTNWQFAPSLNVPRGFVRFRILNASTSKELYITTDKNIPIYLIANEGGLLEKPIKTKNLFLVAGDRAEIAIDTRTVSKNTFALITGNKGNILQRIFNRNAATQTFLKVRVDKSNTLMSKTVQKLPENLTNPRDTINVPKNFAAKKDFIFAGASMMSMMDRNAPAFTINNKGFVKDHIDTRSKAGTWEQWTIKSQGGHHAFEHSFHVHASSFVVLSVNNKTPDLQYRGWQDTIYIRPKDVIKIAVPITTNKGLYVYHCHILEHEDLGMMGTLEVY